MSPAVAAWGSLQLGIGGLAALGLVLDRAGLEPRAWTRAVRGWVVLLPIGIALSLAGPAPRPSRAVWTPPPPMAAVTAGARAARGAAEGAGLHPRPIPWVAGLGALVAASVLRTAGGAAAVGRRIRRAPVVRRIGRVEVRVTDDGPSCAIAWGGRAVVLVDRASWRDPDTRTIVLRHELAHHRHRDPQWAWAWAALSAVALPHPVVRAWHRRAVAVEELAVDQAVIRTVAPAAYARVLLEVAARPVPHGPVVVPSLTHPLHERLAMLTSPRTRRAPAWLLAGLGASVAVAAAARPAPDAAALAAAASSADFVIPAAPAVADQLERLTGDDDARRFLRRGLRNLAARPELERGLVDAGLPAQLVGIALIESGVQNLPPPAAESMAPPGPMGAGVWMFIPSTARAYGLRVDDAVDERLDVARETEAAVALLSDLHDRYGDWALALAGYNQGERHVDAAIAEHGTRDAWALIEAGALNEYAASVMAAAIVLEDPSLVR